jgi:ATP-dependent Zn protease
MKHFPYICRHFYSRPATLHNSKTFFYRNFTIEDQCNHELNRFTKKKKRKKEKKRKKKEICLKSIFAWCYLVLFARIYSFFMHTSKRKGKHRTKQTNKNKTQK